MRKLFLVACLIGGLSSCNKEKKTNDAGRKMQAFVQSISAYAKTISPNFIIIPQNGIETIFEDINPENPLNMAYLNAIDGYGIEELFYDGKEKLDSYKLDMLRKLAPHKPIMVSEFINDSQHVNDAVQKNKNEGFLCFPRIKSNYHYKEIPAIPTHENANNILKLEDAKNYLYLINSDNYSYKSSFLSAIASTNYDVVMIDLFFEDEMFTEQELQQIQHKANGAKRLVIAYMNIGSVEKFRYYWQKKWKLHNPKWIQKKYDGYNDEYWVQFWNPEWQNIIFGNENAYLYKILNAHFDGVYLDNIEAFYTLYHNK